MAVIEGQIEPLKKLKDTLHSNGITRFSSIGEINSFIQNYETEKNEIPETIAGELDREINQLQMDLTVSRQDYETLKADVTSDINRQIKQLEIEIKIAKEKSDKSFLHKTFYFLGTKKLTTKKSKLEKNFNTIISKKTRVAEQEVHDLENKLEHYTINREIVVSERCQKSFHELEHAKQVIDGLYNLIAGAIGENSVLKEVQKLPDNFHLFNDFSLEFDPPIYNKKEDDRIYSIQIDHLLVCEAGIFALETKNWGKGSVESIDLRSPIKQIRRSSYALFVLLNSTSRGNNINLESHHWGSKQIPVRNLIIMTNAKPKGEFRHVKVLSLKELNGYVSYFDSIFSTAEVENICDYLKRKMA